MLLLNCKTASYNAMQCTHRGNLAFVALNNSQQVTAARRLPVGPSDAQKQGDAVLL